jgi:hypothetical protein
MFHLYPFMSQMIGSAFVVQLLEVFALKQPAVPMEQTPPPQLCVS